MNKSIIFDWSGVVKDAVKSQLWIVNRIFETNGVNKITLEEFQENWEQPYNLFYRKYLSESFSDADQEHAYKEAILSVDCPKSSAVSGMVDVIKKLKAENFFLAVVSSDLKETLSKEVIEYGLEGVFDVIVTDSYDKHKDVEEIIVRNNLNPENTFFIGDSNHEIDVSRNLGIKSIAVTWGYVSRQRLQAKEPNYIVESVRELERILL